MQYFDFKKKLEDFIVEETIDIPFKDKGKVVYYFIQKKNLSTGEFLDKITKYRNLPRKKIGIAGLKDKRGLTRQRISIYKNDIEKIGTLELFEQRLDTQVRVMDIKWADIPLQLGKNRGNRFIIRLRNTGKLDSIEYQEFLEKALEGVINQGVPNFFGEQRFGTTGGNRKIGQELVEGVIKKIANDTNSETEKKFKIQAFGSYIFNEYLKLRIKQNKFHTAISGDIIRDPIGKKYNIITKEESNISKYVFITGPIPGDDLMIPNENTEARKLEDECFKKFSFDPKSTAIFKKFGIRGLRRAIKMNVLQCKRRFDKGDCIISLELGSSCYASTFLEHLDTLVDNIKKVKRQKHSKDRNYTDKANSNTFQERKHK